MMPLPSRYGSSETVDPTEMKKLQREINAPFLEVVGFEKVNRLQKDFANLRIVSLKNGQVFGLDDNDESGDVSELTPNLRDLDLSDNLISKWEDMVKIGASFKCLKTLNVSGNRMRPLSDFTILRESFAVLEEIHICDMQFSWEKAMEVARNLPALQRLRLSANEISDIPDLPPDCLKSVKELDLSENPDLTWKDALKLRHLPNLIYLNVNKCGICYISFDDIPIDEDIFPALQLLQLSHNKISSWASIANMNRMKIRELRIRSNPILETENGETCRQLFIASIATLKVVNGTELFKTERYGAELDYLKKFGKEYLSLEGDEEKMSGFFARHPRYGEFLRRFGAPEPEELVEPKKSIKSRLLEVNI